LGLGVRRDGIGGGTLVAVPKVAMARIMMATFKKSRRREREREKEDNGGEPKFE